MTLKEIAMSITASQARLIADAMQDRLGDAAVAVAMLKSQLAEAAGDTGRCWGWRLIAEHLTLAD
jgi:hypothetical protein